MKLLIKNGKMLKKDNELINVDIYVKDGIIYSIGVNNCYDNIKFEKIVDVKGNLVTAGLIDMHVHLREPGYTYKETIKTGSLAAARGGFTTICAMPNVKPIPNNKENLQNIYDIIRRDSAIKIFCYSPITKDLYSDDLVNFEEMKLAKAIGFTNDGVGVQNAKTMYLAMKYAAKNNTVILAHAEDESLLFEGVVNEGSVSKRLSLPGILSISESSQVARDIVIAKETGARYHVCHVSSRETVCLIRQAKKEGIKITCEVTPHHLLLTEDDIKLDDANYKMNPPLRKGEDKEELIKGLLDGTIDCIATDHAPHSYDEKLKGMLEAPFGIVGLETAFSLLYTNFVETKIFTLRQLLSFLTINPAKILNLDVGELRIGARADISVFDIENEKKIDVSKFKSKSNNTPFNGFNVKGETILTVSGGVVVWERC